MAWRNHPTLLLHPITHEVYRVPETAMLHDCKQCIFMGSEAFKDLASVGSLSAEKFLKSDNPAVSPIGFRIEQVLAVRLKGDDANHGSKSMFAWASRMTTHTVCQDWTGVGTMGEEFIWLWPPGKAWNAWVSRQERRRLKPDETPLWGIDECEPSVRYMPKHPGLMLGPDDIDGCERVPLEELTVAQRLFVACIQPQQTLFARRSLAQDWTERITRMINASQESFQDETHGAVRLMHALRNRSSASPKAHGDERWAETQSCPTSPVVSSNQIHRLAGSAEQTATERRCHMEYMRCMQQPAMAPERRKRVRCGDAKRSLTERHKRAKEASLELERALASSPDDERIAQEHRQIAKEVQTAWITQYQKGYQRRWGSLPDEVLVNILCLRLLEDLGTSTKAAAATMSTLCRVSKGVRIVAERFIGAQLKMLECNFKTCMLTPHFCGMTHDYVTPTFVVEPSLLSLNARMRRMGLDPRGVLHLSIQPKREVPKIEDEAALKLSLASLPPSPTWAPDWRAYLRLRKAHEEWLGRRATVKRPRRPPSGDFIAFYASMRATNPVINGERFAAETSGRAHLPDPAFDPLLCSADGVATGGAPEELARAGLA